MFLSLHFQVEKGLIILLVTYEIEIFIDIYIYKPEYNSSFYLQ